MKTVSRQYLWQIARQQEGLCVICAQPQTEGSNRVCEKHLKDNREIGLKYARMRNGIPVDAPVNKGHPLCKEWAKMEPENYQTRYAWARNNLSKSPEELEAKAQDLLIFANMLRKGKVNTK